MYYNLPMAITFVTGLLSSARQRYIDLLRGTAVVSGSDLDASSICAAIEELGYKASA